jgi:RHS repeat-associated protein
LKTRSLKFCTYDDDVLVDHDSGTLTKDQNGPGIDNKLSVRTGTDVKYFLADHLGSTNGLADSTGAVPSQANYDAFGNQTGNLASRYGFTGRENDSFTGLMHYRARQYDPKLGRFISEDPIGFAGGDINLYGYVRNRPTMLRDPTGKIPPLIVGGVVLATLILASPSYVNAPGPNDPIYGPDNDLILNLAGGYVVGGVLSKAFGWAGSKFCTVPTSKATAFWGAWDDYAKVVLDGEEFAQVGNRLFSRHAVDRMQPSGMRYRTGGSDGGFPEIRQTGGNYDFGRGVAPGFVEDVISSTQGIIQLNGNLSHTSGTLQVIVNGQGHVITIITR